MKLAPLVVCSLLYTAAPALAQAPSQHPRVGQLAELTFDAGSAKLPAASELTEVIGPVAAWAQQNPDGLVVIDGHADATGSSAGNVKISMKRAQAVREQLVTLGVDPDAIVIAAYGDDASGKPAQTAQAAARDRRVIVWGTRSGMKAIVARTMARGHAVIATGAMAPVDRESEPGAVARR